MNRDEIYHQAIRTAEALEAVWRQQPENRAALERYSAELSRLMADLPMASPEPVSPPGPPPDGDGATAREGEADPPAGPVAPSQEPDSEEQRRRREAATMEHLPGGPMEGSEAAPSLGGVSDATVARAASLAAEELSRFDHLLASDGSSPMSIGLSLERLREILSAMPEEQPRATDPAAD